MSRAAFLVAVAVALIGCGDDEPQRFRVTDTDCALVQRSQQLDSMSWGVAELGIRGGETAKGLMLQQSQIVREATDGRGNGEWWEVVVATDPHRGERGFVRMGCLQRLD